MAPLRGRSSKCSDRCIWTRWSSRITRGPGGIFRRKILKSRIKQTQFPAFWANIAKKYAYKIKKKTPLFHTKFDNSASKIHYFSYYYQASIQKSEHTLFWSHKLTSQLKMHTPLTFHTTIWRQWKMKIRFMTIYFLR